MQTELIERAARMPSQGGVAIAADLRRLAAAVPDGMAIVEVGAWLGAGTAQLALGVHGRSNPPTIHVYDRFTASRGEIAKAAEFEVALARGQNTLPVVQDLLGPLAAPCRFHRGPIGDIAWAGGPIGLYVDDAAKKPNTFFHVMRSFGPSFVPGTTVLVLMDFNYWKKFPPGPEADTLRVQTEFIAAHAHAFEPLADADPAGTSAGFFRYVAPVDFAALPVPQQRSGGPLRILRRRVQALFGSRAR